MRPESGPAAPLGAVGPWTPLRRASFAAGAALLAVLLVRAGPAAVAKGFAAVGWVFAAVLALGALAALLNTLSWRLAIARERRVPFGALLRMLLAGEAVNTLSPVGFVGGELVRFASLRRWISASDALASVVLGATSQFAGQVLFIVTAVPAALVVLKGPAWRSGVLWAAAAAAALLTLVLLPAWWPDAAARLLETLARAGRLGAAWSRVAEGLTASVRESLAVLRRRPVDFTVSVAVSFAAWQVGVVETLVVMVALGRPVTAAQALAIELLAVVIEGILFFVPAKMGTLEGGRVLAFAALGLSPADGLVLGLVRRARELAWAVPGLALLGSLMPRVPRGGAPSVIRDGPPLPD